MSLEALFKLSGQSMVVQAARLGLTAEVLAHTDVPGSTEAQTYRPRRPRIKSVPINLQVGAGRQVRGFGVEVAGIVESTAAPQSRYQPDHPDADSQGRVYYPAVSVVEEMATMMSAAREFDAAVTVYATGRQLHGKLMELGALN